MGKGRKKQNLGAKAEYLGWRSLGKIDPPKHYWLHITFVDDCRDPVNDRRFNTLSHLQVLADGIANGTCTIQAFSFPVQDIESVEVLDPKCKDPNFADVKQVLYHAEPRHFQWFGQESRAGVLQEIADRVRGKAL